jgi:hypothetical protein
MTEITINLARGPDGQPVGRLRVAERALSFTGWLDLIRLLEDELRLADGPAGERQTGGAS